MQLQLTKSPEIIKNLSEFDDYFKSSNTDCWSSKSGKINLYCFSTFYTTVYDFEKDYKELRDHVAISFQSRTLQSAAERWNLYLLYMVKETVPQEIKQRVVHDKFSARKIVHTTGENTIDDKYIEQIISSSLLDISIKPQTPNSNTLNDLMQAEHPEVAAALASFGQMNNRDYLPDLIKLLSDE